MQFLIVAFLVIAGVVIVWKVLLGGMGRALFSAKGELLAGARVLLHGVERSEEAPKEPGLVGCWFDLTITPVARETIFQFWDPGDLSLVDHVQAEEGVEGARRYLVHEALVYDGTRFVPVDDKLRDRNRVRIRIDVSPTMHTAELLYFDESLGLIDVDGEGERRVPSASRPQAERASAAGDVVADSDSGADADVEALRRAVEWSPSTQNRRALALSLISRNRFEEALPVIRAGLGPKPPDEMLLLLLATATVETDALEEAREALRELRERYPRYEEEAREALERRTAS